MACVPVHRLVSGVFSKLHEIRFPNSSTNCAAIRRGNRPSRKAVNRFAKGGGRPAEAALLREMSRCAHIHRAYVACVWTWCMEGVAHGGTPPLGPFSWGRPYFFVCEKRFGCHEKHLSLALDRASYRARTLGPTRCCRCALEQVHLEIMLALCLHLIASSQFGQRKLMGSLLVNELKFFPNA